jgi:anti-sigma B factor antagonist
MPLRALRSGGIALAIALLWAVWWVFFATADAIVAGRFGGAITLVVVVIGTVARVDWEELGVRFLTDIVRTKGARHDGKPYTGHQQAMPFETRQIEPGITVVTVVGNLVWGCRDLDLLETTIESLLNQGQKNIVFDLAALNYADSSGMGVLISCLTQIKNSGGDLRLVGAKPRVQKLLRLARVDDLLATAAKGAGG